MNLVPVAAPPKRTISFRKHPAASALFYVTVAICLGLDSISFTNGDMTGSLGGVVACAALPYLKPIQFLVDPDLLARVVADCKSHPTDTAISLTFLLIKIAWVFCSLPLWALIVFRSVALRSQFVYSNAGQGGRMVCRKCMLGIFTLSAFFIAAILTNSYWVTYETFRIGIAWKLLGEDLLVLGIIFYYFAIFMLIETARSNRRLSVERTSSPPLN
jgi:hypothetical protein